MTVMEDLLKDHIAKLNEIQQSGMDFAKRVAEHHVEVVERKILPEHQVAEKLFASDGDPVKEPTTDN